MKTDREQFLENRRQGIGGSDIAALLGESPWISPLDLYLDKIGEGKPKKETEAMMIGTLMEPAISDIYAAKTGLKLQRVNTVIVDPKTPHFLANIDRAVINSNISKTVRFAKGRLTTDHLVEIKNVGKWTSAAWGDPGTDQVPDGYYLQCVWYLARTGCDVIDASPLFSGNRHEIYPIRRDEDLEILIENLEFYANEFWEKHVVHRVPPSSDRYTDIAKLWPKHRKGKIVTVDMGIARKMQRVDQLRALGTRADKAAKALIVSISEVVQDGETIQFAGKDIGTFRVEPRVGLDHGRLKAEQTQIVEQYTRTSKPRVFRVRKKPISEILG